eukprot:4359031-Pyramimonas_sp.AAC.1
MARLWQEQQGCPKENRHQQGPRPQGQQALWRARSTEAGVGQNGRREPRGDSERSEGRGGG